MTIVHKVCAEWKMYSTSNIISTKNNNPAMPREGRQNIHTWLPAMQRTLSVSAYFQGDSESMHTWQAQGMRQGSQCLYRKGLTIIILIIGLIDLLPGSRRILHHFDNEVL